MNHLIAASLLLLAAVPAVYAQGKNPEAGKAARQARLLAKFDANHNGVLDPEEQAAADKFVAEHKAAMLAKYDKNGDGKLDKAEREAMRADRQAAGGKHKGKGAPAATGTNSASK